MKILGSNFILANNTAQYKGQNAKTIADSRLSPVVEVSHRSVSFCSHKLVGTFPVPFYPGKTGYSYVLGNGQKVVIVPKPDIISLSTVVDTGSVNETVGQEGISHLLEHMILADSKGLTSEKMYKYCDSKGGEIAAETTDYATSCGFSVECSDDKTLDKLISHHAQVMKYPLISPQHLRKEKEIVTHEINEYANDSSDYGIYELYKMLFGFNSKSHDMVLGNERNIRAISPSELLAYHRANYTPDNMTTYVVGDVNPKKVIESIDKAFDTKDFRPSPVAKYYRPTSNIQKSQTHFLVNPNINVSNVFVGFVGPKNIDFKDYTALSLLMSILGADTYSRLNKYLNKMDTVVNASLDIVSSSPNANTAIVLQMPVDFGKEQAVLDLLKNAFKNVKRNPITQDELEAAKRLTIGVFNDNTQISSNIAEFLSGCKYIGGEKVYAKKIDMINSITLDDIHRVFDKYFRTDKAAISVVQPKVIKGQNISFGRKFLDVENISVQTLPNNIKLVINDNPNLIRTSANIYIRSKEFAPIEVRDVLINMLALRTAKRNEYELSRTLVEQNTNVTVCKGHNGVFCEISSMSQDMPKGINIALEMLLQPYFSHKTFEKAIQNRTLELQCDQLDVVSIAEEHTYGAHPQGETEIRLAAKISDTKFSDVKDYYSKLLKDAQMTVVVSGPISREKGLKERIEKELSSVPIPLNPVSVMPTKPVKPLNKSQTLIWLENCSNQAQIARMFNVETADIKEIAALDLLSVVLSGGLFSRLVQDLRESQKLAYEVSSLFETSGKIGQFTFFIETGVKNEKGEYNHNIQKSLTGFQRHINKVVSQEITRTELEIAKKKLHKFYLKDAQDCDAQNDSLTSKLHTKYGTRYYEELQKALDKMTVGDIQKVAAKFLTQPSTTAIILSPEAFSHNKVFLEKYGNSKILKGSPHYRGKY